MIDLVTYSYTSKQTQCNAASDRPGNRVYAGLGQARHPLLRLQQTIGNRAVGRLLQAKLTISQSDDRYEQEADRIAEQVMRMPDSATRSETTEECGECQRKRPSLQREAINSVELPTVPLMVHEVLRSPGQPLDPATRAFMESRFDYDFGQVRIHTNARADESSQAVNARAYTVGRNIVFGADQFSPKTSKGIRLLAHELTHVIQQGHVMQRRVDAISRTGDVNEMDDNRAALAELQVRHIQPSVRDEPPPIQRKEGTEEKKLPPEEIAAKALRTGPKSGEGKTAYEKAIKSTKDVETKGTKITRVEIPLVGKDDPVKGVPSSEFESQFEKSRTAKKEPGLPQAFIAISHGIIPPDVASDADATTSTNVRVVFDGSSSSGKTWVTSANLSWTMNTAGYLDISKIDPNMLKPYQTHEAGHRTIAHQIRDRLAKMLQVELAKGLPTEEAPIRKKGKDWGQQAVDAIISKIDMLKRRYEKWFDELSSQAHDAWNKQEKNALTEIATAFKAKEYKPGPGPQLKE